MKRLKFIIAAVLLSGALQPCATLQASNLIQGEVQEYDGLKDPYSSAVRDVTAKYVGKLHDLKEAAEKLEDQKAAVAYREAHEKFLKTYPISSVSGFLEKEISAEELVDFARDSKALNQLFVEKESTELERHQLNDTQANAKRAEFVFGHWDYVFKLKQLMKIRFSTNLFEFLQQAYNPNYFPPHFPQGMLPPGNFVYLDLFSFKEEDNTFKVTLDVDSLVQPYKTAIVGGAAVPQAPAPVDHVKILEDMVKTLFGDDLKGESDILTQWLHAITPLYKHRKSKLEHLRHQFEDLHKDHKKVLKTLEKAENPRGVAPVYFLGNSGVSFQSLGLLGVNKEFFKIEPVSSEEAKVSAKSMYVEKAKKLERKIEQVEAEVSLLSIMKNLRDELVNALKRNGRVS